MRTNTFVRSFLPRNFALYVSFEEVSRHPILQLLKTALGPSRTISSLAYRVCFEGGQLTSDAAVARGRLRLTGDINQ